MNLDAISLFIIVFAILPGLLGYWTYRAYFGFNWRQSFWERVLGIVLISVLGLALYIIVSPLVRLPYPIYVLPATFDSATFSQTILDDIAISYLGHTVASVIVVVIAIFVMRLGQKWLPNSPFPGAWDDFARNLVKNHWVVVKLTNGEAYAGILYYADISVNQNERDIILLEPALFQKKGKNYKSIPYQYMFLPADLISSVGIVSDQLQDERVTEMNSMIFKKGNENARRTTKAAKPAKPSSS